MTTNTAETVRYDPLTGALHHDKWMTLHYPDGAVTRFNAGYVEFLRWPSHEFAKIVFPEPEPLIQEVPREGWFKRLLAMIPGSSAVEREVEDLRVGGSTPPRGTKTEGLTLYPK